MVLRCKLLRRIVGFEVTSGPEKQLSNLCRWHVHCCSRHYRVRLGVQYHGSSHSNHGTCFSNPKSPHGEYLQFSLEPGCYCSCLDNIWHIPHHEQLGVENPFSSTSTVQRSPDPLLLVDCRISPVAHLKGSMRRSTSYHHQSKLSRDENYSNRDQINALGSTMPTAIRMIRLSWLN